MAATLAIFIHPPAIYVRSWDVSIFIASLRTCTVSAKRPTSISPAKRQQGAPILASERGMQARWIRGTTDGAAGAATDDGAPRCTCPYSDGLSTSLRCRPIFVHARLYFTTYACIYVCIYVRPHCCVEHDISRLERARYPALHTPIFER